MSPISPTQHTTKDEEQRALDTSSSSSPPREKDEDAKHDSNEEEHRRHFVEWDGEDDPENPTNLPRFRKWVITINLSLLCFTCTFSSSVFSTTTTATARYFNVSKEIMVLGTSLYLLGFVIGPFIFGPLSELFGRKKPLLFGFTVFVLFQIPVAVATDVQSVMIFRFFQGVFGSAPQSIAGGALADIWTARERGFAVPMFAGSLFMGPIFGPVLGSFITESHLGWRWTSWITLIMAAAFGVLSILTIPETFKPVLLVRRATRLRLQTKNWALHAPLEEHETTAKEIRRKFLLRPIKMLFLEPILFLVTLYIGFVFGIIYLCFEAFPISYSGERHWSPGVASLPFIAVFIGSISGCTLVAFTTNTRLAPNFEKGRAQEARLILMALGGSLLPVGLFWFAWTSFPSISPWPQIISGVPIGFGLMMITLQGLNYVIDCYTQYANSALAANTSVRYLFGAGFPLFATGMYHNLGVRWATSLLGFIGILLLPVPFVFYIYGERIRRMSRFKPS